MKKTDFFIRLLLVAVSVLLIVCLLSERNSLMRELADTEERLETSRATWQAISDTKEALQEDLTNAKNDLREADLTIGESGPQREKLLLEIEQLRSEIEELKQQGAGAD